MGPVSSRERASEGTRPRGDPSSSSCNHHNTTRGCGRNYGRVWRGARRGPGTSCAVLRAADNRSTARLLAHGWPGAAPRFAGSPVPQGLRRGQFVAPSQFWSPVRREFPPAIALVSRDHRDRLCRIRSDARRRCRRAGAALGAWTRRKDAFRERATQGKNGPAVCLRAGYVEGDANTPRGLSLIDAAVELHRLQIVSTLVTHRAFGFHVFSPVVAGLQTRSLRV